MNPWQTAYEHLCGLFGETRLVEATQRVEVRKDNCQVWHLITEQGNHWFRWSAGEGTFLEPNLDRDLPSRDWLPQQGLLAYRPGRRAVWSDPGRGLIWKGFRKHKDLPAARHLQRVETALGKEATMVVPKVLEHRTSEAALGLEVLHGEPLQMALEWTPIWRSLGSELARFQAVVPTEGLTLHSSVDEIDLLADLANRYQTCAGELPLRWSALFSRAELAAHEFRCATPVACHRDLHDGQFKVEQGRLGLLDLDLLCVADPALDLGNLTAHIVLRALQDPNGSAARSSHALARALLDGYAAHDHAPLFTALRFYQTTALLRLALVYALRPKWRSLSDPLLAHAERALSEISHG